MSVSIFDSFLTTGEMIAVFDDAAIVQAILSMAHKLNLGVVAEGVETVDQLNYLRGHHCDWVQGYFFSPPKPAAAITDFFTQPWLGRSLAAS